MELPVTFKRVSDETVVDFKGDPVRYKRYDFFLGTHGPFTERVPLETFNEAEITLRIQRLRAHLSAIAQ
jgi:hypothetical protein